MSANSRAPKIPPPLINGAAGFPSAESRRNAHEHTENLKQTFDIRHSIFGQECSSSRLKSRLRFLGPALDEPPSTTNFERTHQTVFVVIGELHLTALELGWLQQNLN